MNMNSNLQHEQQHQHVSAAHELVLPERPGRERLWHTLAKLWQLEVSLSSSIHNDGPLPLGVGDGRESRIIEDRPSTQVVLFVFSKHTTDPFTLCNSPLRIVSPKPLEHGVTVCTDGALGVRLHLLLLQPGLLLVWMCMKLVSINGTN